MNKIPVSAVVRENRFLKNRIVSAIDGFLETNYFIGGPALEGFEHSLTQLLGRESLGCANGTDAISLLLVANKIGTQACRALCRNTNSSGQCTARKPDCADDWVIVPAVSAFATAVGVLRVGAKPLFVDIDPTTGLLDLQDLKKAIDQHHQNIRAIIPVSLYGSTLSQAHWNEIENIGKSINAVVIEDAAQSFGTKLNGKLSGTIASGGATYSFYPTKNLGAVGDGGAVISPSESLSQEIRWLRNYGERARFHHESFGWNSRLDPLQAAVLSLKLKDFGFKNDRRRKINQYYREKLGHLMLEIPDGVESSYHLTVLKVPNRDEFRKKLDQAFVETAIQYPVPMPEQKAAKIRYYRACPHAMKFCSEIVSIPGHAELTDTEVEHVVQSVLK